MSAFNLKPNEFSSTMVGVFQEYYSQRIFNEFEEDFKKYVKYIRKQIVKDKKYFMGDRTKSFLREMKFKVIPTIIIIHNIKKDANKHS